MSILPGIYASQITGHLSTNSFESIQTVTVGSGGQSSISFSSIPSTYKHLQIRFLARSTSATVNDGSISAQFNSDTGNNYTRLHYLQGDGATAVAGALQFGWDSMYGSITAGNNASANVFGVGVIDILDYTNTNKYKVIRHLSGMDNNGAGKVGLGSGTWSNTAAITSIQLGANSFNWTQYSSFALYGVK